MERYIGIDVGAETIKLAEVGGYDDGLRLVRHAIVPHGKEPGARLLEVLQTWDWRTVSSVAATGRLGELPPVEPDLRPDLPGGDPAFDVVVRGYRMDEVDARLESLQAELESLRGENDRLTGERDA